MTGARDITQLCFSSNLAGIVANKIEQSFYSCLFLSRSGIESIEHALTSKVIKQTDRQTDKPTDIQTDGPTDTDRRIGGQTDIQSNFERNCGRVKHESFEQQTKPK